MVKNWMRFQHYKVRNPPWIKLYRSITSDYSFNHLTDVQKCHLVMLWVEAANNDGKVANDPSYLRRRLSLQSNPDLKLFINNGWLVESASNKSEESAIVEKSRDREEKNREETSTALSVNESKKRSAVDLARNLARKHTTYAS